MHCTKQRHPGPSPFDPSTIDNRQQATDNTTRATRPTSTVARALWQQTPFFLLSFLVEILLSLSFFCVAPIGQDGCLDGPLRGASRSEAGQSDRLNVRRRPDLSPVSCLLTLASLIVIGMLISYLPQHARIIKRRTSEGISPYFVLLGTTSATSAFANILLLPQSRQDVACCKELETFHCIAGLLGIAQLGVQWICFSFMWVP
jgi:hypothetical protein